MQISPKYFCSNWIDLNLNKRFSENWRKGAEIVHDRIYGRYLAQIEVDADRIHEVTSPLEREKAICELKRLGFT